MTQRSIFAIAFATLLLATTSRAQTDLNSKTYIGFGGQTCKEWRLAEAGYGRDATVTAVAQAAWIWGFASGFNVGRVGLEQDWLKEKDAKYLTRWVGRYCDRNESHTLWEAGTALVRHLRGQE